MSIYDELSKLNDLKNKGIITSDEFDAQKIKLLDDEKPRSVKKKRPFWHWALVPVVALTLLGYMYGDVNGTPACDSPELKQKVVELINKQVSESFPLFNLLTDGKANALAPKIHSLTNAKEISHNKESGFRACVADTKHDTGTGEAGYTIEWSDKEKGEYFVHVVNSEALIAKYGKATPVEKDAPPVATTENRQPDSIRKVAAVAPPAQVSATNEEPKFIHNASAPKTLVDTQEYENLEQNFSAEYHGCVGNDIKEIGCTEDELSRQDSRLNTAYKAAMKVITIDEQAALKSKQRIWITKRETYCDSITPETGTYVAPLINAECKAGETIKRSLEIEKIVSEGHL